jgi:lipoprotein-anchoring transpeptidase ErfK/SrfK
VLRAAGCPVCEETMSRLMLRSAACAAMTLLSAGAASAASTIQYDPITHEMLVEHASIAAATIPRETVPFAQVYAPGTVIVNTTERRLYLVQGDGTALRYCIGVGRDGFQWGGAHSITAKREWPAWTPPPEMLKRQPELPRHMAGGLANPLGARAMYLGSTIYRIHGSNEPWTIGQAVSSGCFRMTNDDVADLYDRVKVGAKVIVLR